MGWRQQLRIIAALRWLYARVQVQRIAQDLG